METKILFSSLKNFKLSIQIKRNSINVCDILKLIISVRGGHCGAQVSRNLATSVLSITGNENDDKESTVFVVFTTTV